MSAPETGLSPLPEGAVEEWLREIESAQQDPEVLDLADSLRRLREAAAVLTAFDRETLQPVSGNTPFNESARERFFADTVAVQQPQPGFGWRLTPVVRRRALEGMACTDTEQTRARLRDALAATPQRPDDRAQQLLEAAIEGDIPNAETLDRDGLIALAAIVEWLGGIVPGLPAPDTLAPLIGRAELLEPLRKLVGTSFVGREEELRRLADHVGVLDIDRSAGLRATLSQFARRTKAALDSARRPLFVHGPGGVGKSSVLARFVLDHDATAGGDALPFAWLDVDRPSIEPLRPLTLLVEALGQLEKQLTGLVRPARELSAKILDSLRSRDTGDLEAIIDDTGPLVEAFARLLNPQIESSALLLIVDTFEDVQFLGPEAVHLVLDLIGDLQRQMPQLRVVLSGRMPVQGELLYNLPLAELPPDAARELLSHSLEQAGHPLPPAAQLDEIVKTLGGSPMVLRLAARLIANEDFEGIRAAGRQEQWLRKLRVEALQARLYGRVLGHIQDPEARKLAFPGLLLRRINADIVEQVLAGPCDLKISADTGGAFGLITRMAREVALVSIDSKSGDLVYLPYLRRVMLDTSDPTLVADGVASQVSADIARQIDEGALKYWSGKDGAVARAEEIYHRLRLGQPRNALEKSWDADAAPHLRTALGELRPEMQGWLADKLGVSVTEESRADALQGEWEAHVARSARRLLEGGKPDQALTVLRERDERQDGSVLPALEVRALYALDRLTEARHVAEAGIEAAKRSGDAPGEVELRLLSALVCERTDLLVDALAQVNKALETAEQAGLQEPLFRVLVRKLRLMRHTHGERSPEFESTRLQARELLGTLGLDRIRRDQSLLRDAAAELGEQEMELLHMAIDLLGVEALRTAPRRRVREVLERTKAVAPDRVRQVIGGDPRELAKLATDGLINALFGSTPGDMAASPVGVYVGGEIAKLAVSILQDAATRAMKRIPAADEGPVIPLPATDVVPPILPGELALQRSAKAMAEKFPRSELQRVLRVYLSRELETYTSPSVPYEQQVLDMLTAAQREGWQDPLTKALARSQLDESNQRATLNRVLLDEFRQLGVPEVEDIAAAGFGDDDKQDREYRAQNLREIFYRLDRTQLSALCLSGGGIRSATFNLGVIQALARIGLLDKFDYLSSVSGGGYIASWLRTWMRREGSANVIQKLARGTGEDPLQPEPAQVSALREFSNYLTPKLGLFSADTWSVAAIVVRNLILNWLVILPLLGAVIAIPQVLLLLVQAKNFGEGPGRVLFWAALGVELVASVLLYLFRRFKKEPGTPQGTFVWACALPVWLAAATLATSALGLPLPWVTGDATEGPGSMRSLYVFAATWCIAIPVVGWALSEIVALTTSPPNTQSKRRDSVFWELPALILSGIVAGLILVAVIVHWLPYLRNHAAWYVILATPLLLGIYLIARALFVAIASLGEERGANYDADREWWGRLSGWILIAIFAWIAIAGLSLLGSYLPFVREDWSGRIQAGIAALGGVSGLAAALVGGGSKTPGTPEAGKPPLLHRIALAAAAPLFAVCVLLLVGCGTAYLIEKVTGAEVLGFHTNDAATSQSASIRASAIAMIVPVGLLILSWITGRVVNVNRFSLHGMYRNRLVRAYLGASNVDRKPDPFTGFAPQDNVRLHDLWQEDHATRPLPIINTTLNLVGGGTLAWQQRKAESFSMTPFYCGNFREGYRTSQHYGGPDGISVGTAVTTSGAAANPNMGFASAPTISFLMALFNARLGAWLGNTNERGERTFQQPGPRHAWKPLLAELFGLTTRHGRYVNLSDGGHFDNLGLYEVVLRRCRNILVCDAGQDRTYAFDDLGNAIRKIRIDFGIPIEFTQRIEILPGAEDEKGVGLYCSLAEIRYDAVDGDVTNGHLVYVKPTLRGRRGRDGSDLPYDVYSYSKGQPEFPHEPTSDQWFSESQFESYRMLGFHTLSQIAGLDDGQPADTFATFLDAVKKYASGDTDDPG